MRQTVSILSAALLAAMPMLDAATVTSVTPSAPATPIQHIVVIFQENVSFDHYFGTYPVAFNPPGEPSFTAAPGTPSVNGFTDGLRNNNPNLNTANGSGATNPFRLDRSQAATADQDHDYTPEQMAFHGGLMDLFPMSVGTAGPPPSAPPAAVTTTGLTMGYYDGNTVTALWNYAQKYAMNDNSFGTNFGPSTVGAINLVSGQTNGVTDMANASGDTVDGGFGSTTVIGDPDPMGDVCAGSGVVQMGGQNIGDLLSARNVTWGFFSGGFNLNIVNPDGTTGCSRTTTSKVTNTTKADYIPHHQPFQYYPSTANPTHARPTSLAAIGHQDAANHQYDIDDFFAAVSAGNFPAVSFLKARGFQDGHAGYSDPIDEQDFVVTTINFLQNQPAWKNTMVIIAYRESIGEQRRCPSWSGKLRHRNAGSARSRSGHDQCPRPLRIWTAPSFHGDLALRQAQLRGSHPYRPKFDHPFHRRQLARRAAARRGLIRCPGRFHHKHAELQFGGESSAVHTGREHGTRSIEVVPVTG
jgi:phospholipase C